MHPAVSELSWMDLVNEFVAGDTPTVYLLPKDAFGNNVSLPNPDLSSYVFNVSASYFNGSAARILNATSLTSNRDWYLAIKFIVAAAGDLLLHIKSKENIHFRGSPLPFKVNPGTADASKCFAKWKYGANMLQLYSRAEIFIYQLDNYDNLTPGSCSFDVDVLEKDTNLSIPVADLSFKEASPGVQLLTFTTTEPGNFFMMIYDENHNNSIANIPYSFTVFVGYADESTSIINGSGLNSSVAGSQAIFQVYLHDKYHYPSPVPLGRLQAQIVLENSTYSILPIIHVIGSSSGSVIPRTNVLDSNSHEEVATAQSFSTKNSSAGTSKVMAHSYDVLYTPEKSGLYNIHVLCGNIILNGGKSLKKEVKTGEVNMSLSSVVRYELQVQEKVKNYVVVSLVDSFGNPVPAQQSKLKLEINSTNHSGFSTGPFIENQDGSYTGYYLARDSGNYNIHASFSGNCCSPCPFEVRVYPGGHFPKANDDWLSVMEDESIAFDVLGNDYIAHGNTTIIGFSYPRHGSLLHDGVLFRYTPYKDFYGNDSFTYTLSDVNGNVASASVNIYVASIPPRFVSIPAHLVATEDILSPKFGGFHGFEIRHPDLDEIILVNISAKFGTLSLSPMLMQFWEPFWSGFSVSKRGEEDAGSLAFSGRVEVINLALQSIQYLGKENFYGYDTILCSSRNGNGVSEVNVTISVEPVNDPPFILAPEFIILKDSEDGDGSLIYGKGTDEFEFLIGDPDLPYFSGKKADFVVMLTLEVDSGTLEGSFPIELINSTEQKLKYGHQWEPPEYVSISKHFKVGGKGLRFQGTIDECNSVIHHLKYHVGDNNDGAVLTIAVNDLGNYGCYHLDCAENMSRPLLTEANINLVYREPIGPAAAYALGAAIIIEFAMVLSLGVLLVFFTCKCAVSLIKERKSPPPDTTPAKDQPNIVTSPARRFRTAELCSTRPIKCCRRSRHCWRKPPTCKDASGSSYASAGDDNHQESTSASFAFRSSFSIEKDIS